ncbi:MAG: TonB family protein, partial [Bacteroidota bacterium]
TTDYVSGVETFVPGSGFGTQKVVTGRITSLDDGKPLSGVSVFNNNYNAARAISGSDGSFKIAVQDTSNVLTFSTSGYYQSEVQVGRDNILDIQMKDSLIEIKADSVSIVSRSMEILKPKESIKLVAALNYQQYLSDSLIYPQEATEKRISGEVELTIQISNDGSPISIVVSQSLGFGCDEEAIRLIKEGPKLIHLVDENEQSTEAVIIVEFRLKN